MRLGCVSADRGNSSILVRTCTQGVYRGGGNPVPPFTISSTFIKLGGGGGGKRFCPCSLSPTWFLNKPPSVIYLYNYAITLVYCKSYFITKWNIEIASLSKKVNCCCVTELFMDSGLYKIYLALLFQLYNFSPLTLLNMMIQIQFIFLFSKIGKYWSDVIMNKYNYNCCISIRL